ncbi:hypothetical protein V2J09_022926 [Rumex salicifolius]
MDLLKVFDQTVRDIKREVNLKVLKVPEIEQKVLDATDDEPWGPHGTALAEIAQATKKFTECQMVMNVLWTRLGETGKDWRYVYKALSVIEYLIANGSERAVDDIVEHTFQISVQILNFMFFSFEYVEPNGKDVGINVRKKAETIVGLLNNKEKIEQVRNKAAATRDKYVGLSSTGMSSKSSSAAFGNSSFRSSSGYGGYGGSYDSDAYNSKDKDENQFGVESSDKFVPKSRRGSSDERKKESTSYGSKDQNTSSTGSKDSASRSSSKGYDTIVGHNASESLEHEDDDDDDFDPRATSKAKSNSANPQVDLFGDSLIGDFMDVPTSIPSETGFANNNSSTVDLFADATFVSAPSVPAPAPKAKIGGNTQFQPNIDLFASGPASSTSTSSNIDLFAASDKVVQPEANITDASATNVNSFDPFAAVPLNNFSDSDPFGAFSSFTDSSSLDPTPNTVQSGKVDDMNSIKSSLEAKIAPKNNSFQVKSGIWADSLNRGIIDLNITAPKKVSLADVGIVGGLTDAFSQEKQKGPQPIYDMGRAMGTGSGLGITGFTSSSTTTANTDDIFSNWSYLKK